MTPIWAKAPFMLLRHRKLFASSAFGALLLTVAIAAFPLFISSASSDLLEAAIREDPVTRYGAGLTYRIDGHLVSPQERGGPLPRPDEIGRLFARAVEREPLLGSPVASIRGPAISVSATAGTRSVSGRSFSGPDVMDHLDVLTGGEGPGVFLPDLTADAIGVQAGESVRIGFEAGHVVLVRVAGIYRALINQPPTGFWSEWNDDIYARCAGQDCPVPAQFVIVREDELRRLSRALGFPVLTYAWQAPIASGRPLTMDDARDLIAFGSRLEEEMSDGSTTMGRAFRCCGAKSVATGPPTSYFGRVITALRSDLPLVLTGVERRTAAVEEPGRVLVFAAVSVSLAVIAGSGIFMMASRRVEAQLLFARGTHPARVAAGAAIEAMLPCLVGVLAGLGVSFLLLRLLGPGGPVSGSEVVGVIRNGGLAGVGSITLIGLVSAVVFLRQAERHRERHAILLRVPWEVGLAVLAAVAWQKLRSEGAFVEDPRLGVQRPSIQLLAFPALSIAGVGAMTARAFGLVVGRAGGRKLRSSAAYLAVRRLAGSTRLPALLVAASTVALGLGVHGAIVAGSIRTTMDVKARAFVGSDASGRVLPQLSLPENFPMPVTPVVRRADAGVFEGTDAPFDLLAIDARTFRRVAFWNEAFSDVSIDELSRSLTVTTSGRLPIVVSGADGPAPDAIEIDGRTVGVSVVARARAFPGMISLRHLVVVDREQLRLAFGDHDPSGTLNAFSELWVKGDPARANAALQRLRFPAFPVVTVQQVKDIPEFSAVIGTFWVMDAVAVGAALLVVIVILMYLNGRQRSQIIAFGFSVRMGMTSSDHRRSLILELGAMLLFSFIAGLILGGLSAWLIVPLLDPLASIPPAPLFVIPTVGLVVSGVVLLVVAWAGGAFTTRGAARTDLGQAMRVAE